MTGVPSLLFAMTYRLADNNGVLRLSDNAWIPPDDSNSDYVEYLEWLAAGNSPEPALPSPPPGPDYHAFWEGLLASSLYASIREQSMVSLPMNTLGTEFIALMVDAKSNRVNEAAIQASISAILSVGTFSKEQLQELGDAFVAGNLDSIYSIA